MSYKPDEKDWMAYLYGELEGDVMERFDQYLLQNPDARLELEKYRGLRSLMGNLEDKEVIAPPIVVNDSRQRMLWDAPYFKTIISIAASLIIVILVAKFAGIQVSKSGNEIKLSFGDVAPVQSVSSQASLTPEQVQLMINSSLHNNNEMMQTSWKENEARLTSSIRKNLASNSGKINQLVREASTASQEQIQQYVSTMQAENMALVKNYFQMTSTEQKKYVENLLVDFASYLQQQRNNDLQLVQTQLNSIQQNTNTFKQETEEILSSIISTVSTSGNKEIRN